MAANSPYDIYLGSKEALQGYRVRQFVRDSAPQIAPKFSSGAQGQSDLDLLKVKTWKSFRGGMFQREWKDDERGARVYGFYNIYDENLYSAPYWAGIGSPATYTGSSHSPTAECTYYNGGYVAHREGALNVIHHIPTSGAATNIALPAALSGGATTITSLIFHKGYLFACGQNSSTYTSVHRYDVMAGTWVDMVGGILKMFTLRGNLYGVNYFNIIYQITNEDGAGAATFPLVKQFGHKHSTNNLVTDAVEFNGAAWIANPQGLWRFDGAEVVKILDQRIRYLTPYNGALYYEKDGWLWRFDGTNIERLQYFGQADLIYSMKVVGDYLAIACETNVSQGKYAGSDSDGVVDTRIYTWDGVGFQMVFEADLVQPTALLTSVGTRLLLCSVANASFSYGYIGLDFATRFQTTTTAGLQPLEIVSSEFDDGFPNVDKSLEYVEVDYNDIAATDTITVSYQYFNGEDWSSWITLGTITSTSDSNRIEVIQTGSIVKLAKAFKLKAAVTRNIGNSSNISLRNLSLYYTLQPKHRWRWQVQLIGSGADRAAPIMTRNGSFLTNDANELTNLINKSIKSKTPIYMLAPDYGLVKTSVNAAATSFIVKGQVPLYTDPYNEYPLVAVKNNVGTWEILRVASVSYHSGNDETTLTLKERGYLGITAGTVAADAEFHLAYRVYVTRLLRDAAILDEATYNQQTTGESQIKREFFVEVTEV
jgi:hypothetical protein